jgi:hypothetical protein
MGIRVLTCLVLQLVHHLCRPGIPRILYTKQKVMPDLPVLRDVLKKHESKHCSTYCGVNLYLPNRRKNVHFK